MPDRPPKYEPPSNLQRLFPAFPGTKDIRRHPLFKGGLSRWIWRVYTHRLTRSGRWFAIVTAVFVFSVVPSLDIQPFIPLLYIAAIWLVALLIVLVTRPQVSLSARHGSRIRAGGTLTVEVTLMSKGRRFGDVDLNVLPERLPLEIDAAEPLGVPVGYLKPGEARTVRIGLSCPRRGVFRLWGYRVESDFPFGIVNSYRNFPMERTITVHPAFEPLLHMDLPAGRRNQPGGVLLASHLGDSFEYLGNREYREGDNIRDIDWRSTARHGGSPIALREYREEFFLRVGLVLDTHIPPGGRAAARAARREALERAVSVCAGVSEYLSRQDYLVDLFAAGPDLYHLTSGRSLAYLEQILDILACVESTPREPLETIAPRIHEYLTRLSTVICVFPAWDEPRRHFVEQLRDGGAGVKVIIVPPEGEATISDSDITVVGSGPPREGRDAL